MSDSKIYAGLLCNNVEIFRTGDDLKIFSGGKVRPFSELSFMHIQAIKEAVSRDPAVEEQLRIMHPDSEMKRIEQFASCNFSGLDHHPDIADGVLQEGEYWDCPKRGLCPAEGIVCKKFRYGDQEFSSVELKMIKLLTTDITNDAMAAELLLPLGTFHLIKKKLYEKLSVATKQELTLIAVAANIVQAAL